MPRDAEGLSGLWADASPVQRAEVMRMREQYGATLLALQERVREGLGEEASHEKVEAQTVLLIARARMRMAQGWVPEGMELKVHADWATDPQILKMFGELALPSGYTDAGVPPEGQRRGWVPDDGG